MVERACFTGATEVVDYSEISEANFDWQLWIDQETRRR